MPKVGLDVRVLSGGGRMTGIPMYVSELSRYLIRQHPDESTMFSDRPIATLEPISVLPVFHRWVPWQQSVLPWALHTAGVEVFHGPAYALPSWGGCTRVVTVHDLGFLRDAQWVDDKVKTYLTRMVPLSMRLADRIVVPSAIVQYDVERWFPKAAGKVHVISMGSRFAGTHSRNTPRPASFPIHGPYILHVGTHEPRKNLFCLLSAFKLAIERYHLPHVLVLIGTSGWKVGSLAEYANVLGIPSRVIIPGYVSDDTLETWYRFADLYVQPSLYEGFGIGTLDAFCMDLPIATTKTGWIGGVEDPAVTWINDATDEDCMSSAIVEALALPKPQRTTDDWTWSECCRKHWELYSTVSVN